MARTQLAFAWAPTLTISLQGVNYTVPVGKWCIGWTTSGGAPLQRNGVNMNVGGNSGGAIIYGDQSDNFTTGSASYVLSIYDRL